MTQANLNINRNISGIPESGRDGQIGEPETDGLPEATLVLSVADFNTAIDDLIDEAIKRQNCGEPKTYKATLIWEGCEITGSDKDPKNKYTLAFDIPAMQIREAPVNAPSPGARVPVELTFGLSTPTTAPDGTDWSWVVVGSTPLRARIINENTTSEA